MGNCENNFSFCRSFNKAFYFFKNGHKNPSFILFGITMISRPKCIPKEAHTHTYRINSLVNWCKVKMKDYCIIIVQEYFCFLSVFLRQLVNPPKIDIENVRVSRKVILDRPDMESKERSPRYNRLVLRRNGLLIERPQRPK